MSDLLPDQLQFCDPPLMLRDQLHGSNPCSGSMPAFAAWSQSADTSPGRITRRSAWPRPFCSVMQLPTQFQLLPEGFTSSASKVMVGLVTSHQWLRQSSRALGNALRSLVSCISRGMHRFEFRPVRRRDPMARPTHPAASIQNGSAIRTRAAITRARANRAMGREC